MDRDAVPHLRRTFLLLLVGTLLSLGSAGCSWFGRGTEIDPTREPAPTPITEEAEDGSMPIVEPEPLVPASADSSVTIAEPLEAPVVRVPEPEVDPVTPATPEPAEVGDDDRVAAPVDSSATDPVPSIRVQISEEERQRLVDQTGRDLETARATAARQPDLDGISAEQRVRWETLDHYIRRAESFLEADDVRAASELALKARLLAAELKSN